MRIGWPPFYLYVFKIRKRCTISVALILFAYIYVNSLAEPAYYPPLLLVVIESGRVDDSSSISLYMLRRTKINTSGGNRTSISQIKKDPPADDVIN